VAFDNFEHSEDFPGKTDFWSRPTAADFPMESASLLDPFDSDVPSQPQTQAQSQVQSQGGLDKAVRLLLLPAGLKTRSAFIELLVHPAGLQIFHFNVSAAVISKLLAIKDEVFSLLFPGNASDSQSPLSSGQSSSETAHIEPLQRIVNSLSFSRRSLLSLSLNTSPRTSGYPSIHAESVLSRIPLAAWRTGVTVSLDAIDILSAAREEGPLLLLTRLAEALRDRSRNRHFAGGEVLTVEEDDEGKGGRGGGGGGGGGGKVLLLVMPKPLSSSVFIAEVSISRSDRNDFCSSLLLSLRETDIMDILTIAAQSQQRSVCVRDLSVLRERLMAESSIAHMHNMAAKDAAMGMGRGMGMGRREPSPAEAIKTCILSFALETLYRFISGPLPKAVKFRPSDVLCMLR
jgi:hypothetical protein